MFWPHTKTPVVFNKQLQTKRPIIILTLTTFYLYLTRIIFLRLDTISFLQRRKNYTHSSRQKIKIHRYPPLRLCSGLRLIQDRLCADISLVNVIYTKSSTFPSSKISGIMRAFLLNVRSPAHLELKNSAPILMAAFLYSIKFHCKIS